MQEGFRIRLKKIGMFPGGAPAILASQHIPGTVQPLGYSLPEEYEIEGILLSSIMPGYSVEINRDTRNGVKQAGYFETSLVKTVIQNKRNPDENISGKFATENSIYSFEILIKK